MPREIGRNSPTRRLVGKILLLAPLSGFRPAKAQTHTIESADGAVVADATAKVPGAVPDSAGRIQVSLDRVAEVFGTPNLLVVSAGTTSLGQLCCNPPYRQLQAVDTRQRWELDEA